MFFFFSAGAIHVPGGFSFENHMFFFTVKCMVASSVKFYRSDFYQSQRLHLCLTDISNNPTCILHTIYVQSIHIYIYISTISITYMYIDMYTRIYIYTEINTVSMCYFLSDLPYDLNRNWSIFFHQYPHAPWCCFFVYLQNWAMFLASPAGVYIPASIEPLGFRAGTADGQGRPRVCYA